MSTTAGPTLALVQVPADVRPALEAALARVWTGRVVCCDAIDEGPDAPVLAVVAGRQEAALAVATSQEALAPDLPFLAIVEGARRLRGQRGGLPGNVAWAIGTDEFDARLLGLSLRFALEVGARKRLEKRLRAARPLADMGWVAGAASHEIGNPLTGLLMNLELARGQLLVDAPDLEALRETITDALDGARHVSRIASDLGRASRRSGRTVVVDAAFVLETARRLAVELLVHVEIRTKARMVPPVRVDETRLCQVFLNVLKNASEAMNGRPGATLDLTVDRDGDEVVVRMADNGPGMDPDVARRVFDPWFSTRAEGSGLGLALCRQYLSEMNGRIEVTSVVGQGTTFEIRLPAAAHVAARPTLVPDRPTSMTRVLVVDDTAIVRRAIQRALSPPHHVDAAGGGAEALVLLATNRYDVVFVDLQMPGQSGIEFYEEVVEHYPSKVRKVVFLSGAFERDDLAYLEQRNLRWIRKPVGAEELRDLVIDLLGTP